MSDYKFSTVVSILQGKPLQQKSDPEIEFLLTDSRKLLLAHKTLFFSISSEHRNANIFIPALYNKGVRCFVVDNTFNDQLQLLPEANIIKVPDVLKALQQLASFHRKKFTYPVIGISGSNGKTIVKEWLFQLLCEHYHIIRNPKSYNSQVGVPLSVWQMNDQYNLAIFEAGISQPEEMSNLQNIICPGIGIFTNIGEAHSAGFESRYHKVVEKMKLFASSEIVIYNADDKDISKAFQEAKEKGSEFLEMCWSRSEWKPLKIINSQKSKHNTTLSAEYKNKEISITVPFTDNASIENIIHCWCVLLILEIPDSEIAVNMLKLKPLEMRLQLKQGINNCSLINDSYSADLTSLNIALDFLDQQQQHSAKTLILSDILQSNKNPDKLYSDIANIIRSKNINKFVGVGLQLSAHSHLFNDIPSYFYADTTQLLDHLPELNFKNETILLKGARIFQFETISYALEEKTHETILEINLNAIRHNLNYYKRQLVPGVKLMIMVKALSYGSGSFEIANVLQHAGVDYLAVAYADEGLQLRKAGIRLPIMVMNTESAGFENIIRYQLEPELYSLAITEKFIRFLQIQKIKGYPVHLKLDTGMHRLGFEINDLEDLCSLLQTSEELKVRSVFSHLAASDNALHDSFTIQQSKQLVTMAQQIESAIGYTFLIHLANSSAIHRHPGMQYNMVRLGVGLYGVDPAVNVQKQLQTVTTLRTTVSQVKNIPEGDSVGYNRRSIVDHPAKIATVRVGYADGYPRSLSNGKGKMLVNGTLVPVIGNVCMDMTMLDVTGVDVDEGDPVIVFGENLSVTDIAEWADTIAYEILTGISHRVKRVYYEE